MKPTQTKVNGILISWITYIIVLVVYIITVAFNGDYSLQETLKHPLYYLVFVTGAICVGFWIYSIYLWNKYDKDGWRLVLLILFSLVYVPFYYKRIRKILFD